MPKTPGLKRRVSTGGDRSARGLHQAGRPSSVPGRSSHFAGYASAAMGEMLRTELGGGQVGPGAGWLVRSIGPRNAR